jgi:membrane protein DedA with SNARE-associated domain
LTEQTGASPEDHIEVAHHPGPRPGRRTLLLLVVPIIVLVICTNVGDALTTTWAEDHPLWLTLLNSRTRILVLTTNQMDPVSYYVAAGFRLLLSDPLFYLIGYFYGDAAVQWVERRSSTYGQQLRWFERAFKKASYPLVFLMPNNIICLFAGASGMRVPTFLTLNITGTAVRLYLIRRLGEAFEAPIDDVLGFFARYRLQLLIASVLLVVIVVFSDRRKGKGELEGILDLEHEIERDLEQDLEREDDH